MRVPKTILVSLLAVFIWALPAWAATEVPVSVTRHNESGPAAGSGGRAWNTYRHGWNYVTVEVAGITDNLCCGAYQWTGGIDGNTLAFQRASKFKSKVTSYDLASGTVGPDLVASRFWEWSPSISGDWVLVGRNNVNMGQKREWKRMLLVNITTDTTRTLDEVPGARYMWPGQVNGNWAVWQSCSKSACPIYLHDIAANSTSVVPTGGFYAWAPAVSASGTVYYAVGSYRCGRGIEIVRYQPGGATDVIHAFPRGVDAYDLYVDTSSGPPDDVYLARFDCQKGSGDIAYLQGADSAAPLAPTPPVSLRVPLDGEATVPAYRRGPEAAQAGPRTT